jgi:hypothetical protein
MLTAMPAMQKAIAAVDAQPSQYSQPSTTSLSATSRRLSAPAWIVIRCASDQPRSKPLQKTFIRLFWRRPLQCAPRGWDCRRASRLQRQEAMRASLARGQRVMRYVCASYGMNITSAGCSGHFDSPFGRQARLTCAAGLMVPEDREQQNDRQRYAQQPQQCASSKAHGSLLH